MRAERLELGAELGPRLVPLRLGLGELRGELVQPALEIRLECQGVPGGPGELLGQLGLSPSGRLGELLEPHLGLLQLLAPGLRIAGGGLALAGSLGPDVGEAGAGLVELRGEGGEIAPEQLLLPRRRILKLPELLFQVRPGILRLRQLPGQPRHLADPGAQLLLGEREQLGVIGELVAMLGEVDVERRAGLGGGLEVAARGGVAGALLGQLRGGRVELTAGIHHQVLRPVERGLAVGEQLAGGAELALQRQLLRLDGGEPSLELRPPCPRVAELTVRLFQLADELLRLLRALGELLLRGGQGGLRCGTARPPAGDGWRRAVPARRAPPRAARWSRPGRW